jgi:ribulose 1,5-bisphosphate synthetase/thiazole synthase
MSAPCTGTLGIVETTTGTSTMREYHLPPVGSYRVEGEVVVEESRTLPVAAEVDVVVAGGGPAGLGAAVGAARAGASVLVVERNAFLGGTATAVQMATWNMSLENMTGFARELAGRLIETGGAVGGGPTTPFDPEAVKRVALDYIRELDIQLLLYSTIAGPVVEDGRVIGVVVENKSGRQAVRSRTVVDCTGDADVAARAGAAFVMGREKDSAMRPMTILVRLGGLDLPTMVDYARAHPEEFDPDPNFQILDMGKGLLRFAGFYTLVQEAHARGELDPKIHYLRFEGIQVNRGVAFLNSVRVYDVDGTDAFDLTRAEIQGRSQADQLVSFIRKYIPGCSGAYVVDTSPSIGVRETRRIVGRHVLTEDEIDQDAAFDDAVARLWRFHSAGFEMHSPDPVEGAPDDPWHRGLLRPLRSYQVPYGALVPRDVDGLLAAGRCISTTHAADGWTRGMYCCMVTGQAAGVAAALAARHGVAARNLDVREIQDVLAGQGVDTGRDGGG